MSLPSLSAKQLKEALLDVGVEDGDGLLIHSALQFLGQPDGGSQLYLDVIEEVLGDDGTLAVPTFTFAFARGEDFDPGKSPSEHMGVFSELVRLDERAMRTNHPMQSLALLGKYSEKLAALESFSAFDDGSAFDRMLELDFKLLLLGADVQAASIVHYSEQRANVPYRYWKDFNGRVLNDGAWQKHKYRMFVRDLEIDPQLKLAPIQERLVSKGQWSAVDLNYGKLALFGLKDFVVACDELLTMDPWALISNRESIKI